MKFLRFLPEVVSNLLGALAWHRLIYMIRHLGFGIDVIFWVVALSFGAVLIAAPFYRIMRKPRMRRHFALFMLPLLLLAPGLVLELLLYDLAVLLVIVVLAAVPAFPIVAIYERLFYYAFAEKTERENGKE